jgi:hypothetical protein
LLSRWASWCATHAIEAFLTSRAVFDVHFHRLALGGAELLGKQPLEVVGRGTWSQLARHDEISSTHNAYVASMLMKSRHAGRKHHQRVNCRTARSL